MNAMLELFRTPGFWWVLLVLNCIMVLIDIATNAPVAAVVSALAAALCLWNINSLQSGKEDG